MRTTNKHHLFWPASAYRSELEYKFRNLPCHIVELNVKVHQLLHETQTPPAKPLAREMLLAVHDHEHGNCPCRYHSVGNVTYLSNGRKLAA